MKWILTVVAVVLIFCTVPTLKYRHKDDEQKISMKLSGEHTPTSYWVLNYECISPIPEHVCTLTLFLMYGHIAMLLSTCCMP